MCTHTFDYFYMDDIDINNRADSIEVPRALLTEKLSFEAKLLYGFLADKMEMSLLQDEDGKVYIEYSVAQLMRDFDICKTKAITVLREMEAFGLIERRRRPNRSAVIYIKKLGRLQNESPENGLSGMEVQKVDFRTENGSPENGLSEMEVQKVDFRTENEGSENGLSEMEVQKVDFRTENGSPENGLSEMEVQKVDFRTENGSPENGLSEMEVQKVDFRTENEGPENGLSEMEVQKVDFRTENGSPENGLSGMEVQKVDHRKDKKDDDDLLNIFISSSSSSPENVNADSELMGEIYKTVQQVFTQAAQDPEQLYKINGCQIRTGDVAARIRENLAPDQLNVLVANIRSNGSDQIYNLKNYIIACLYNYQPHKSSKNGVKNAKAVKKDWFNDFEQRDYDFAALEEALTN